MWSEYSLEVIDAVGKCGSFTAAAQKLHRVPSAISYTVSQLEEWLAVEIFERRHRDVVFTEAGKVFAQEGQKAIKRMDEVRRRCQQIANGWQGHFSIAVDLIVKSERMHQLVIDFYKNFPDMELFIRQEVFNGVWDALADGRADMAIGATAAVPVGGHFGFRDMGLMNWYCVAKSDHPAHDLPKPIAHQSLRIWPTLIQEDTSHHLPKRITWLLDNQRRLIVPNWESGLKCLLAGLCIGMVPEHLAKPLILSGQLKVLKLVNPLQPSSCCVSWRTGLASPVKDWLLIYLGDTETLNQEWLK
ncbi:DNA-binding transcriptional activator PunR [Orbaceae bacterium ESL0727]|nr:DNA-binding transcriptional activator PunR [Orbaceae bacterium ESL0727]